MRRAAKVDAHQAQIVQALRQIGARVLLLHRIGQGCPDLLVWHRGRYMLVEVKSMGEKPNKEQRDFIERWPGELHVVYSVDEALQAVLGKAALL